MAYHVEGTSLSKNIHLFNSCFSDPPAHLVLHSESPLILKPPTVSHSRWMACTSIAEETSPDQPSMPLWPKIQVCSCSSLILSSWGTVQTAWYTYPGCQTLPALFISVPTTPHLEPYFSYLELVMHWTCWDFYWDQVESIDHLGEGLPS